MDVDCENVTQLLLLKYHWKLKYFVIRDGALRFRPVSTRGIRPTFFIAAPTGDKGKAANREPTGHLISNPPAAQQYNPATGAWTAIGNTPVSLIDPFGNNETGPAVTRPDGSVVAFGGNTGCTSSPANPTAIYTPSTNTWVQGPHVPAVCGSNDTTSCDLAEGPAVMKPNENILFAAKAGYLTAPTHFFEFAPPSAAENDGPEASMASVLAVAIADPAGRTTRGA
jgi:hypothetical protein